MTSNSCSSKGGSRPFDYTKWDKLEKALESDEEVRREKETEAAAEEHRRRLEAAIAKDQAVKALNSREEVKNSDSHFVLVEDLPREDQLGPGGLDPTEVFESLPEDLQEAFENQDKEAVIRGFSALPPEVAKVHLQRCVDAGLWEAPSDDPPEGEQKEGEPKIKEITED
uniref:Cdc37 C-terminal domain-containing protein n=1 Tax=Chromera velia CCMP2878 TaxID=1169474 RepID=A0A0G4HMN3_9ALVE|eukprot:Cvel_1174.t1-p1 / transcript=Cvel_1174.t1 / gene=Cvel_1174 / organism=Chromera_velia_CCMP2878 / gene_product=Hsp90 co-chaperone Cdc37, putative / transcript_product=Hsp90 co-chaperone Cdc37, putative / location=Cvel_scaffold39:50383-51441(+) / protein_length=168 / sequence_SO=supercontig / SO=protein_coding / is_pseudo=false